MAADRAVLIEQIELVFIEHGFEGATLTQLSRATGLGKASLYHYFPGGKAEMARELISHAITLLQQKAFRHLLGEDSPATRLHRFLDGFSDYVRDGSGHCLVAVLAQGSLRDQLSHAIASQYDAWLADLAAAWQATPMKPKAARRRAEETISLLYGALVTSKIMGSPKPFRRTLKQLHKSIDR